MQVCRWLWTKKQKCNYFFQFFKKGFYIFLQIIYVRILKQEIATVSHEIATDLPGNSYRSSRNLLWLFYYFCRIAGFIQNWQSYLYSFKGTCKREMPPVEFFNESVYWFSTFLQNAVRNRINRFKFKSHICWYPI